MEEHIVEVTITIDEADVEFKVSLKTELPLFKVTKGGFDMSFTVMENEEIFYASERRLARKLNRRLRRAMARYKRILTLRNSKKTGKEEFDSNAI